MECENIMKCFSVPHLRDTFPSHLGINRSRLLSALNIQEFHFQSLSKASQRVFVKYLELLVSAQLSKSMTSEEAVLMGEVGENLPGKQKTYLELVLPT